VGSIYRNGRGGGGGSSQRGSIYRRGGAATATPAKQHHDRGGPFGFVENLAGDVGGALVGLPGGLVETVRNPIKTAKAVGKSYGYQYGPFIHGNFDEGFKRFYNHPLGPILDALTIASLGAGAAAAVPGRVGASVATTGRAIRLASPAKLAHGVGPELLKPVSRRPLRGWQQIATDRTLKMLPVDTPLVGEVARYARALDKAPRHEALRLRVALRPFQKAYSKLKEPERIAFNLLGRGIDPEAYKGLLIAERDAGGKVAEGTLKLLDREDVRAAFADPSPRLLAAVEAGREAAGIAAGVLVKKGWMTPETAAERPYLAARIASGARFDPKLAEDLFTEGGEIRQRPRTRQEAEARIAAIEAELNPQIEKVYKYLRGDPALRSRAAGKETRARRVQSEYEKGRGGSYQVGGGSYVDREFTPQRSQPFTPEQRDWRRAEEMIYKRGSKEGADPLLRTMAFKMDELEELRRQLAQNAGADIFGEAPEGFGMIEEAVAPGITPTQLREGGRVVTELQGGKSIDEIRTALKAGGKPEPFYLPDAMAAPKVSLFKGGGGRGPTRRIVYRNEALLLRTGQLALEPDLLSGAYLRTVKGALYDDLHQALVKSAVRFRVGEPLPEGWVFLRRSRRERIRYTEKHAGDFERSLDDLLPDPETFGEARVGKEDFASRDASAPDLLEQTEGDVTYRVAVPDKFVNQVVGEFTKSNRAVDWFLRKPTKVWRALVLNLRPAWLVNNIVGNHLLYAIRFAGPTGLRAYANAVRAAGRETATFKKLVNDLFPEQVEGTFIGSQRPDELARAQNILSAGLAPLDRRTEGMLRRAAVEAAARKHPAVRARLRELPKQKARLERALRELEKDNPNVIREISSEVDAALGSFLNMTPFEQNVVRAAIPFYGWYRAITLVVLKLPIETPGRALLLSKLGAVGADRAKEVLGDVPSFLRGAIPIGKPEGGRAPVITTSGLNPLDTLRMVGRSTKAALAGEPGTVGQEFGGSVNPFIAGFIEAATGQTLEGQDVKGGPGGLAGIFARNFAEGLPQVRLGQAATGRLYQGTPSNPTLYSRDFRSEMLSYLGIPVRRANLRRAGELAEQGR
jgi:hypothetical protein